MPSAPAAGPSRLSPPSAEVHVWRAELGTASRWTLRTVLSRYLDEEAEEIGLRVGPQGKPELAEAPHRLDFNLSHSGALTLIAVTAGHAVGVDVERIEAGRDFLALATRAFEPEVAAAVHAAPPPARPAAFYDAWVRKEALVKCGGGGLAGPEPPGPVAVCELDAGPGYAAALALAAPAALPYRSFSLGVG